MFFLFYVNVNKYRHCYGLMVNNAVIIIPYIRWFASIESIRSIMPRTVTQAYIGEQRLRIRTDGVFSAQCSIEMGSNYT